jgi:hypothetical protein
VDNNYLDLGMDKSGFVHTLPSGRLSVECAWQICKFPGLSQPGRQLTRNSFYWQLALALETYGFVVLTFRT